MSNIYLKERKLQSGFTLLELLMVVSILAIISVISASTFGGLEEKTQEQLAHTEMKIIINGIYRFKADTGYFPREGMFSTEDSDATDAEDIQSDFNFLFLSPTKSGDIISSRDDLNGIGWNGPYLTQDSAQVLHVLTSSDCAADAISLSGNRVFSIEDTFSSSREYTTADSCFVVFDAGAWIAKPVSGQPYRYVLDFSNANYLDCTGGLDCIALISAGPDGGFSNTVGNGDDIVQILRVNN